MHPRQGLKRLLLGALLMTATTTGALAAEKFGSSPLLPLLLIWRKTWRGCRRGHLHHQTGRGNSRIPAHPGRYQTRAEGTADPANGMNLELWFQRFYQHLNGVPEVIVTKGITPMGISEGPYNGKPNPHAWMSPDNALIYVDNIRDALVKYDPANAQTYQRNAEAYKQKITATLEPLRKQVAEIPEDKRWMVTSEGAFSYLARDLGMKELYLWPINADQQGTPQQVRKVIDLVKKHHIPAVFSESTVSDKPARQVARETGAHYGGVLYVDSLSAENGPVPTYIDLLNVTTRTLVQGIRDGMKE